MGDKQVQTRTKSVFLTPDGVQELRAELEFLKKEKRIELAKRLQEARAMAIEENSEYDSAMVEQELLESRIAELERILRDAKIINAGNKNTEIVAIGSTVIIQIGSGKVDEFTIVGKMEANPTKKKISNESPIGMALVGSKMGDSVEVLTPASTYKVKIIEIK
jgi:transcription elongation factor GreA